MIFLGKSPGATRGAVQFREIGKSRHSGSSHHATNAPHTAATRKWTRHSVQVSRTAPQMLKTSRRSLNEHKLSNAPNIRGSFHQWLQTVSEQKISETRNEFCRQNVWLKELPLCLLSLRVIFTGEFIGEWLFLRRNIVL